MNTASKLSSPDDPYECQNTSLFRSYLQGNTSVDMTNQSDKIYGTASSMIVSNNGRMDNSYLYLKVIDDIQTDTTGQQHIPYRTLTATLEQLFSGKPLIFKKHILLRQPPVNGICPG